jgi:apolipoprotein N-acyltransferase
LLILYAFVANCYIPLAGVLWFLIERHLDCHEWHSLSLLTLITILSAAYTPTLFDWNIGYRWFAAGFPLYHLAEIIGFSGLSALTMGANFLAYFAWQGLSPKREKRLLLILTLSFALLNLTGAVLNLRLSAPDGQFNVLDGSGKYWKLRKVGCRVQVKIIVKPFSINTSI